MPVFYGQTPNQQPPGGQGQGGAGLSFWDYIKYAGVPALEGALTGNMGGGDSPPLRTSLTPATPWQQRVPGNMGPPGTGLNMPKSNSIQDILDRLEELQNPGRYTPPMDLLEQQARANASAQYDPVIARIRNQMGAAEGRANRNKDALGTMFNQLSGNLAGEIPGIDQRFQQAEQHTADQYTGLKQGIEGQYAKSQAEQEAMMKRLNIEAAAPDALHQQQVDRDFFVNQSSQDAQVQQNALGQEQRGAVDYTRRGSQMAQVEGTNRQADLMFQLQDLLAQYEGQIGEAEIGKNATYQSNLLGLQTSSQDRAAQQAQRDFENYIKVLNVGQSLQKAGNTVMNVQSPADVAQRALGLGIDPHGAQDIQSVFMSAISSDPMIQAGIDQNFGQALPKEALAARVVEAGRQQGLSEQQLNALQIAALEYFGRR